MKEQIRFLLELHQFDSKIRECCDLLERIPKDLGILEKEVGEKRSALQGLSQRMEGLEKEKGLKEREVEISLSRLREFEGKLSQIKTNKEYQAALKEVAETKKINRAKEDQILELMNQLEGGKKEKQELEGSLQASQTAYEGKKQELEVEGEKLKHQIQGLEEETKKRSSEIEPVTLKQYQRVKKLRREAVAIIQGKSCQGCHMQVPPQLFIEIQKLKKIYSCPTCHRILYLADWISEGASGTEPREVTL